MKPFEIFRTGTHTSASGKKLPVTAQMLSDIAANYSADLGEAPVVVGHPKTDDPAYGWIEKFTVKGDRLIAHPKQVEAQFSGMVQDGRFKTRSIALFPPNDPANPKPGSYYPKHVGFLGAAAPAVSGLKPVAFSAADDALEFTGSLPADDGESDKDITDPKSNPNPKPIKEEASTVTAEEIARRDAELKAREEKLRADEASFAARAADRIKLEDTAFVTALEATGKITPAMKAGMVEFMASLGGDDATFEFASPDGEAATVKKTPRAFFKSLLDGASAQINFSESSADPDAGDDGTSADGEALGFAAAAYIKERAASGVIVSAIDAVNYIQSKKGA